MVYCMVSQQRCMSLETDQMFAREHLQERDEVESILQVDEQVPHLSVCLHTQHKHIRPTNLHIRLWCLAKTGQQRSKIPPHTEARPTHNSVQLKLYVYACVHPRMEQMFFEYETTTQYFETEWRSFTIFCQMK